MGFCPQLSYKCSQFEISVNPHKDGCTFGVKGSPQPVYSDIEINVSDGIYETW